MIQRIQSVYLLLTTMLSILFLKGEILIFSDSSGSAIHLNISGIYRGSDLLERSWLPAIVIVIISLLSAIIIALFKKRKIQLLLSKILISMILGFILGLAFYVYALTSQFNARLIPGFMMTVPVLQLIFSFLAYRGIKKDDELVKSYDRLR